MDTITSKLLARIAHEDVEGLKKADKSYGDSWKRRGGVGAFMMLARKWDRIENQVQGALLDMQTGQVDAGSKWNIFLHAKADARPDGILDDIRDLRRYLMLVESELRRDEMEMEERGFQEAGPIGGISPFPGHAAGDEQ